MKKSDDDDANVVDGGGGSKKVNQATKKASSEGSNNAASNGAPEKQQATRQQHQESSSAILRLALGWWCFWIVVIGILYQVCPGEPDDWFHRVPTPPNPPANLCKLHRFPSGKDPSIDLLGRLYLPKKQLRNSDNDNDDAPPIIIMAHGLGLIQDANLQPYVEAFTKAGFVAFTFDYATFGYSGGFPRHIVNPESHVADLKAAVQYIQSLSEEGGRRQQRIGLWGTSMGGGHVLRVAAELSNDNTIQAVVGQVPHVKSGLESVLGQIQRDPIPTVIALMKVLGGFFKWILSQLFLGETTYMPLVGVPGSAAMMQNPNDLEGYSQLIPSSHQQSGLWKNLYSVGHSLLPTLLYRPYNQVQQIQAPTLLIPAALDTLCPAPDAQQAIERIPNGKLILLENKSHFGVYEGDTLQKVLQETVDFFQEFLVTEATTKTTTTATTTE